MGLQQNSIRLNEFSEFFVFMLVLRWTKKWKILDFNSIFMFQLQILDWRFAVVVLFIVIIKRKDP